MGFEHKVFSEHKRLQIQSLGKKKMIFFLFIHLGIFVISEVQNISF